MIPDKELKEFVGDIENLDHIESKKVGHDKYRINVWTMKQEGIVPVQKIHSSYYLQYSGEIQDLTIKA